MTLKKHTPRPVSSQEPFISITKSKSFSFSSRLVDEHDLGDTESISVFLDDEDTVIGFQFHDDDEEDTYTVTKQGESISVTAHSLVRQLKDIDHNQTKRYTEYDFDEDDMMLTFDYSEPDYYYGSVDTGSDEDEEDDEDEENDEVESEDTESE